MAADIGSPQSYDSQGSRNIFYSAYNQDLVNRYLDMPVVATLPDGSGGLVGRVRLGVRDNGNGKIVFDERTNVDESTIVSILKAISFAEGFSAVKDKDYFISYDLNTKFVSGGSTGAAVAIGVLALLENRSIRQSVLITGSVDEAGRLQETGGIPIKVITAGRLGISTFIIPDGQAETILYEKQNTGKGIYYVSKRIDLRDYAKREFNMSLIEGDNLNNILGYILE